MPIEYQIDHTRRLVSAWASGKPTAEEIFKYQRDVWSLPEIKGYNELIDMTNVEQIVSPTSNKIRQLSVLSASMDDKITPTKFAIVAPRDLAYGLGRMYETFRQLNKRSTKEVSVFRSMQEALEWVGKK